MQVPYPQAASRVGGAWACVQWMHTRHELRVRYCMLTLAHRGRRPVYPGDGGTIRYRQGEFLLGRSAWVVGLGGYLERVQQRRRSGLGGQNATVMQWWALGLAVAGAARCSTGSLDGWSANGSLLKCSAAPCAVVLAYWSFEMLLSVCGLLEPARW